MNIKYNYELNLSNKNVRLNKKFHSLKQIMKEAFTINCKVTITQCKAQPRDSLSQTITKDCIYFSELAA